MKVRLYDIYFFLITFFKGLGAEGGDIWYIVAFAIGCIAVILKMSKEHYKKNELIALAPIVTVGLLDFFIGSSTTVLFTAISICGLKNVNPDRIIKISLWARFIALITVVITATLGITQNHILKFWRNGEIINRYSLSYSHPNMLQASVTIVIMLALYIYYEKLVWWQYLILLGVEVFFYRLTYSRTGLLIGVICITISILSHNANVAAVLRKICGRMYYVFFFATLGVGLLYGRFSWLDRLNYLLTGRIQYIHALITHYIPPIIGSVKYNNFVYIDNGYISMIYEGGIIAFIWFSYYITKCAKKASKEKLTNRCVLMLGFFIYAMTESFFPSISVNVSLIFIGEMIFAPRTFTLKENIDENTDNLYTNIQSKKTFD